MGKTYVINAYKNVLLEQKEIEAGSIEEAQGIYLQMALDGEVDIVDAQWHNLSEGDLDIEVQG